MGLRGLEPLTSSLSGKRSNRLSYRPVRHLQRARNSSRESQARDARRYPTAVVPCKTARYVPLSCGGGWGTSVVCQCDLQTADKARADVVQERPQRGDRSHQDDVDDRDDDRQ